MAMFDYAMILASIVIGLALTHLMQGLVGLLTTKMKVWWVHLVWVAFMLLTAVGWWWWEYSLHELATWTFQVYVFVLLYAFGIYVTSALLFPKDFEGHGSYEDYFLSHRRWFFGLQIALSLVDMIDSALKGTAHLKLLGAEYWISTTAFIALAGVGFVTPRRWVQATIAVAYLLYRMTWLPRLLLMTQ